MFEIVCVWCTRSDFDIG